MEAQGFCDCGYCIRERELLADVPLTDEQRRKLAEKVRASIGHAAYQLKHTHSPAKTAA